MNNRKHILFHRPTPWESDIRCSTKTYAKLFSSSGYDVTYLQSAIHLGHCILRRGYYKTWKLGSRFEEGIWVTGGCSLVPYLDQAKALARLTGRLSYYTCVPSIEALVQASGYGTPDIVWTTIPGSSVLKDLFPQATLFFHAIDNYSAYRGEGVKVLEARDYEKADHIFVIGEALKADLQKEFDVQPEKISNLGQGVALDKYQGNFTVPEELMGLSKPIAVWVGLIKKLDVKLLQATVDTIGSLGGTTVLIGPGEEFVKEHFAIKDDLLYLGPKPNENIPGYLRSCDIGLMLYDRKRQAIYEGQHPLKLYEYAAAGLPTISTYHKEFEYLNPPVLRADSSDEVIGVIKEILAAPLEFRSRMLQFASSHSWKVCKNRAEKMFGRLGV